MRPKSWDADLHRPDETLAEPVAAPPMTIGELILHLAGFAQATGFDTPVTGYHGDPVSIRPGDGEVGVW